MKINNCPFCNSSKLLTCTDDKEQNQVMHFVLCTSCKTIGPRKTTREVAIEQWNSAPTLNDVKCIRYKTARTEYPIQPIEFDNKGVIRFKKNRIIEDLLNTSHMDFNKICLKHQEGYYTLEEYEQLNMLIGYSISGFGDLEGVSREMVEEVEKIAEELIKKKKSDQ